METKVMDAIVAPLADQQIKVESVSYVKEDGIYFLRIVIDKEPYIDVDTCVLATKIINPIIDGLDLGTDNYILDVCSVEKGGN